ncbi:MAG: hypothetical protein HY744_12830 [Deltaproteobacteria bacterium]|nr:hypothetical protein [Deltaproteobacteria bacterium]
MIVACLHHRDDTERVAAVGAVCRLMQQREGRLLFAGSPAACEQVRGVLSREQAGAESALCLSLGGERPAAALLAPLRAALREASTPGCPAAVWVDLAAAGNGAPAPETLRDHHRSLRALADLAERPAVIGASRLGALDDGALGELLDLWPVVLGARAVLPCCPPWLLALPAPDAAETVARGAAWCASVQAEKLAALGQLAAGIAHEVGNPLSIISSSLQYLHQRLLGAGDPASEFTMTALQNVDRMHGLLRSMLDFAAVRRPEPRPVDLERAVSDVLGFVSPECERRGLAVRVSVEPALPRVRIDCAALKQILLNLIKNALEALEHGGRELVVRAWRSAAEGRVKLRVEDDGPPIAPEALAQLFRPFNTTKAAGTGLGLYLSRQIARDYLGEIDGQNAGAGVQFTLTLPAEG